MKRTDNWQTLDLLPSYHLLVPARSQYYYSSTVEQFQQHLGLITEIRSERSPADPVVTFDDAHTSQLRYGVPLLQEEGLRAIFFAVVDWTSQRPAYMTWRQLRELIVLGHEVQSHGTSHVQLTGCNDVELQNEVTSSKVELEQKLGVAIDAISIPHGRWNRRVVEACTAAGYRRIYTSDPSPPCTFLGTQLLGRWMVTRGTTREQIHQVLVGDRRALRLSLARHRCKLLIRHTVGEKFYDRVWGAMRSRSSLREITQTYYT